MTKKDFDLIARVLKASRNCDMLRNLGIDDMARQFADALKHTNAQFNRDRFLRACGVTAL